ncbi:MAG: flagellar hook-length control protein FliK [Pseudobdellovibrionaceae bacterium]
MLPSIVGPPVKGVADFKSVENPKTENSNDGKKAGSDSFSQVLRRDETKPQKAELQEPIREKASGKINGADREEQRRPESDDKIEKLTATRDNGVGKKEKSSSSQRQNAILNFMDSFESEFGVPPTRIVEAMANLKPTDLAEAPEATADKVMGQLGLDDKQEDLAKEMYVGLLAQLAQINNNNASSSSPPPPTSSGSGEGRVATQLTAQEKRHALNDSLESMNQKFWMKGPYGSQAPVGEGDLADKLAQMNLQEKLVQSPPVTQFQSPELPREKSETSGKFAELISQAPPAALQMQNEIPKQIPGSENEVEDSEENSSESPEPVAPLKPWTAKSNGEVPKARMEEGFQDNARNFEFARNQQHEESPSQAQGKDAKGEMLAKTKSIGKAEFKKTLGLENLQASPSLKQEAIMSSHPGGEVPAAVAPTKSENEANIRQIMKQAEYLIKKGGGEMKVEMSPEGMGKINMKVLVQDGKVNVQMSAETHEARKTLESSLSDLKNSLAAHKLSMDHIKIDVVSGANTESNIQNQMNQHQGSRDQTRQFWNNFNESFGSPNQQRDGFTDMPNLRGYPRRRTDQSIEPVPTANVSKYNGAGKGAGLNLVA